MKDVTVWLREYLQEHGRTDCEVIRDAARAAGYTKGEIRDAKLLCRVKSESIIYWSLPEDEA